MLQTNPKKTVNMDACVRFLCTDNKKVQPRHSTRKKPKIPNACEFFFVKIKKEAIMAATSLSSLVFFGNEKLHYTQRLSQRAIE